MASLSGHQQARAALTDEQRRRHNKLVARMRKAEARVSKIAKAKRRTEADWERLHRARAEAGEAKDRAERFLAECIRGDA